jgi:hypothetical protein
MRSHQRDAQELARLAAKFKEACAAVTSVQTAADLDPEIDLVSSACYYGLSTLTGVAKLLFGTPASNRVHAVFTLNISFIQGGQTLGQEYCDLLPVTSKAVQRLDQPKSSGSPQPRQHFSLEVSEEPNDQPRTSSDSDSAEAAIASGPATPSSATSTAGEPRSPSRRSRSSALQSCLSVRLLSNRRRRLLFFLQVGLLMLVAQTLSYLICVNRFSFHTSKENSGGAGVSSRNVRTRGCGQM